MASAIGGTEDKAGQSGAGGSSRRAESDVSGAVASSDRGGSGGIGGSSGHAGGTTTGSGGVAGGGGDSGGMAGGAGGGSTSGRGDGGTEPACRPDCWRRLFGGCFPEGSCTYVTSKYCWSNGVKTATGYFDAVAGRAIYRDGSLCSVMQYSGNGYTFYDPAGAVLGHQKSNSDGSTILTCTGEDPVTMPSDCPSLFSGCVYGTCSVP